MECVICQKLISCKDEQVVQNPRKQGLVTIINCAEKRQDEFGKRILAKKDDILSGKARIKYHVDCRKNYTSVQNILSQNNEQSEVISKPSTSTRQSKKVNFNIRLPFLKDHHCH
jgi:hypothetical protein